MRSQIGRLLTLAMCMLTGGGALAASSFSPVVIDPEGPPKAWGKAAADLDGDGRVDFLLGGHSEERPGLYWYRSSDWQRTAISTRAVVGTDIEVVDLDRDGRLDIVATTDTGGVTGLTAFVSTDRGWRARQLVSGYKLHDVEVADLDLDGLPDLVARGQSRHGNRLHLWRQWPAGRWTHRTIGLPVEDGDGLKVADLDLDGRPDIVLPRHWFRNIGTVGLLAFTGFTYNAAAPANGVVAIGQIDGDGRPDIVVTPAHRAGTLGRVSWFKAPADPAAGTPWAEIVVEDGVEADVHFAGIADFDGDGYADLATAATELTAAPAIKIYYNQGGHGTFGPPQILAATSSHNMQVVDADGSGRPSLMGADYDRTGRTAVQLWRNDG